MPRYHITVPVTVFCTYEVEADSESAALDVPVTLSRLFYDDVTSGISLGRNAKRVSGVTNDNADWDRAEVSDAD